MEETGLSVGKSVLNGALSYAKSTIVQEVALQLGVQRDQAFIRDELEMMLAFLMAAHEERDDHKVVKTWVKQVRDVAYDVEDCLQDFAVRLGRPSRWWFLGTLVDRHRVSTRMKELRAKVEDVSQRNVRYHLIRGTGPRPSTGVGLSSNITGASVTMFGIEEARRTKEKSKVGLSQLVNEGNEDLRVIAVWGTSGLLGQTVVIKGAYDGLKRSKKFELYAWVRIERPFNPLEFLQCIMRQFYTTSFEEVGKMKEKTNIGAQVLKKMAVIKQHELLGAFIKHVNEKSYLIVLNDLSTIEEWEAIKEYFLNNKKGSRIIVSTEHGEIANLCAGQESIVSELKQSSSFDQSIFASYDKVSQNQTTLMKPGPSSSEATLSINISVMPTDDNEKMVRKGLTRTGTIAGALEESQLIGREKEKFELINLISKQDDQQHAVISVLGMGGLGKTTLVKEVYQSQELSGLFEKRACITIMRPFVLEEVLKNLVMQLDAGSSNRKGNITKKVTETEKLDDLLEKKRCLIILDDLFSFTEWDSMIGNFSKMDNASRIVITTREEKIAKHCSTKQERIYKLGVLEDKDALDLFNKKVFKEATHLDSYPGLIEEAELILKKCKGLPLAIVTIGGFLAKQPITPMVWRKLNDHLSAELEMNPELGIIRTILMKSYDGLPFHLKSCFLYLSIFPEDYNISRRRLVHRWNVEGYSKEVRGKSTGEVADSDFMELIDRSMILPVKEESIGSRKGISTCKLHDLMREISISKAMEENLVFRMEEGCSSNTQGTIRHLTISSNWEGDQSEFESTVDLSRIRSLTVFGEWKPFYISDKMRLLRVLDLESTDGLVDHHLDSIGKLVHLKYLSLKGCDDIFHLPDSVGNLKQLQTVDISYTGIIMLPQTIVKLKKLQYLRAGGINNIFEIYSYTAFTEDGFLPKQMQNKLCVWTVVMMVFCLSSCSLELGKSMMDVEDNDSLNQRDVCTFWCCAAFPFLARLADPRAGVVAPRGLRKLKALHTLGTVNIARGKAILQDIKMLTQLRKLAVSGINKKNCQEFCSTLEHLSHLESLTVHSREKGGLRGCLDGLPSPPKNLQSLKLLGALGKLPEWIAGLQKLVKLKLAFTKLTEVDGTVQVLSKLPNLAILRLLYKSFKAEEPRCFTSRQEAFPSLTVLELGYKIDIGSVKFEQGTMTRLELLCSNDRISFSGLSSLRSLKEVLIDKCGYSAELVEDLRAQLIRNPKKPVLKFR